MVSPSAVRGPAAPYHEFYRDDFEPREHYRPLWEHVRRTGQALLSDKALEAHLTLHTEGVTFTVYGDDEEGIERVWPLDLLSATLAHAWCLRGGRSLVLQVGQAGSLQQDHCERLFRALVDLLEELGVVRGLRLAEPENDVHFFGPRQTYSLMSESAGWFVSRLEVGQWLQAGDLVGFVYDGFEGKPRGEIRTPVPGLLGGLRRHPLLCEGDLVARLLTRQPFEQTADTYLEAQGQ